jgi:hypothetical protein
MLAKYIYIYIFDFFITLFFNKINDQRCKKSDVTNIDGWSIN